MVTILIIDDEPRQVRSLSNIIQKIRPSFRLLKAYDGQEGWNIIQKESVDVIITDIRMPYMDGMELVQLISEQKPAIKMVLLSGYGEFEYAHTALKCGVIDYLVKPIGHDEIEQMVRKLEEIIAEEDKREKTNAVYEEQLLKSIVLGQHTEQEQRRLQEWFSANDSGFIAIVRIEDLLNPFLSVEKAEDFKHDFVSYVSNESECKAFFHEPQKQEFVALIISSPKAKLNQQKMGQVLHHWYKKIEAKHTVNITVGMSRLSERLLEETSSAYKEALISLDHRFYLESTKLIWRSEIQPFCDHNPINLFRYEAVLIESIRELNWEKVSEVIHQVFQLHGTNQYPHPRTVQSEIIHFLQHIVSKLDAILSDDQSEALNAKIKNDLSCCSGFQDLKYRTKEILLEMIDLNKQSLENKNGKVVQECMKYLQNHYMDEITLDSVAMRFHFSSSYFSILFKNYAGIGFSDYLLKIRIEEAKKLLVQTNDKILNIARKVGFRDPAYFNKIFKRETGISPKNFRNLTRIKQHG